MMSSIYELIERCRALGAVFTPGPNGELKIVSPRRPPEELRQEVLRRKAEILALLTRPTEQQDLWQTRRSLPPQAPVSDDADYHTQRCNAVLDAWKRKDWGPCHRCGQTAWYEHLGFSLCGICTPQRDYSRTVQ